MKTLRVARPTFHLTSSKRQTLELLAEYFCLRVKDLAQLVRNREPNDNDLRTARRTLTLLHQEGLVHRERFIEADREYGNIAHAYGLTDKGVRLSDKPCNSFDEHSARTLDHELEISFFHIALKRFAEQNNLRIYWQQSNLKREIHPDALFAFTDPNKPGDRNTNYFFLEIEKQKVNGRTPNSEPDIIRKLARYHEYYDTDACEEDWNFRKFRVIVVHKNDIRANNLLTALASKMPYRMFWVTSEPLYKEMIDGEIFSTPKDYADELRYSFLSL
jgi:Fe2+ or Zn2+ uptake regulation protein